MHRFITAANPTRQRNHNVGPRTRLAASDRHLPRMRDVYALDRGRCEGFTRGSHRGSRSARRAQPHYFAGGLRTVPPRLECTMGIVRWLNILWDRLVGATPPRRDVRRQDPARREARRSSRRAAHQIRAGHKREDCKSSASRSPNRCSCGRRGRSVVGFEPLRRAVSRWTTALVDQDQEPRLLAARGTRVSPVVSARRRLFGSPSVARKDKGRIDFGLSH